MKHLVPFLFTTLVVLVSIGLLVTFQRYQVDVRERMRAACLERMQSVLEGTTKVE